MTLDSVAGHFACNKDCEAFRRTVRTFLAREGVSNVAKGTTIGSFPRTSGARPERSGCRARPCQRNIAG